VFSLGGPRDLATCSEEVGVYRDSRHSLNVFGLFSPSLGKICSKNRESLNLPLARGWVGAREQTQATIATSDSREVSPGITIISSLEYIISEIT
jgi:hypothetical protein